MAYIFENLGCDINFELFVRFIQNLQVGTEFCTEIESNSPIEGNVPIQPHQTFPLPVKVATSLTSSVVNGVLVLYIGGSSGQLLKVESILELFFSMYLF